MFPSSFSTPIVALALALPACGAQDPAAAEAPCEHGFATSVIAVEYGPGSGFGQAAMPGIVLGPPRGAGSSAGSLDVVSLGLEGTITLGFAHDGIADGDGADFIVFENAFFASGDPASPFIEPGVVSASDDGVSWLPWPCDPSTPPFEGCAGVTPVASHPDNAISPFDVSAAGGDAFDLEHVGLARARFVRIRGSSQVVGSAGTSGFDLDSIAVLHPACP